jgi:glycosyltransferase involved in cell wall biosynthesis
MPVITDDRSVPRPSARPSRGRACLAVIPAHNESATIVEVITNLKRSAPEFDVLVVDDASTDNTADLARAAGARVLLLPFNLGIGGAVQAGFLHARENGYSLLAQVDGDGQHEPAELRHLLKTMRRSAVDVVCGSRFLTEDSEYPAPISRRTGIHIFAFLLSRIVDMRISDPTSGFRLYNRRAIELFARDYPEDYPEVEAVLMLHRHHLSMCEVPVRMYARGGGVSSISTGKSAYYMVKVLLAVLVGLARRRPTPAVSELSGVASEPSV